MAKGDNSAVSCVCSINNSTRGVSAGLSLILFSLVGAAVQMVKQQEPGACVMSLVISC